MNPIIKKIERVLNVKLEEYKYKEREENAYRIHQSNGNLQELYLNNLEIDTFEDVEEIPRLNIKNSSISSLSELLRLKIYYLSLENVVFKNFDDPIVNNDFLLNLTVKNTSFDAKYLQKCTHIKFAFFHDCKIDHVYEISALPELYQLHFHNITFGNIEKPSSPPSAKHRIFYISDMTFKNINFFLPFANISNLRISNCYIHSISDLYLFQKLENLTIDSDTIIENTAPTAHQHSKISCEILQEKQPMNLQRLYPIINYIGELSFHSLKEETLDFIENFTTVNSLIFEKSEVYLDAFLPIATQIENLRIQDSDFKETKHLKEFINLTAVHTNSGELGIKSLQKLFPLKNQLKYFISFDDELEDLEYIDEFSVLETLQIGGVDFLAATQILKVKSLKNLYLHVYIEEENPEKLVLDLKNLSNLERLNIYYRDVKFTGFEHLKQLKSLRIENGVDEINSFPKMESLERLNFEGKGKVNISSEQFPNLKALKIEGLKIILTLDLPTLEILEIPYIGEVDSLGGAMPNLQKLYIPQMQKFLEFFEKTPNLTHLHFEEMEQDNLDFLKPLEKLEYLDIFESTVADIRILNTLPNLKEVNLCGLEHLAEQLENPEKAVYFWINRIHFSVYREDDLWI